MKKLVLVTARTLASVTFASALALGQSALRAVNQLPPELLGQPLSPLVPSLGARLQQPGLERTTLVGTLSTPGSSDTPITVIRENPGRIRIIEGIGATQSVTVVDQQSQKVTSDTSSDQKKLLELLLFDSQEYILFDHANYGGTRLLGEAFPYPKAAATERFMVFDHPCNIGLLEPGATRRKRFFFNQKTSLLEYVTYRIGSASEDPLMETAITWQSIGSEQFPASITQWENGNQVFAIQFTQASAGPTANDNTFVP